MRFRAICRRAFVRALQVPCNVKHLPMKIVLDIRAPVCYTLTMMIAAYRTTEETMNESVQEFLNRGGNVTMCKPMKAYGAQKKQTIKIPARMGREAVR